MLEKQVGVEASYFVQALYNDLYKTFPKTPDAFSFQIVAVIYRTYF
jgi:hypothetical protein